MTAELMFDLGTVTTIRRSDTKRRRPKPPAADSCKKDAPPGHAEREVWVWEEEGAILASITLDDAMLDYLYLEPEMTGRGIGSAFLNHAKQRRPGGFTLWTFQQNECARRFYERGGLRAIRFTDGEGNEEKMPDVLYEWRPAPGGTLGARGSRVRSARRPRRD